jgi:hypothetical protein
MSGAATAILAYPYEGALYWFLGEGGRRHSLEHDYYKSLYGVNPQGLGVRAAALACLFDKIILGSADHVLSDWQRFAAGGAYFHPDLRVSTRFDDPEWTIEGEELATKTWREGLLQDVFAGHPRRR